MLAKHPHVRLAVLFGSLARGEERPESDMDLAVGADRPLTVDEKMALIADLAVEFGRPVDLVDFAVVGEPLLGQILTGGQRVMGDDVRYARLITRHLFDQADFLPYRDRILRERREAWIGK